MEKKKILIVDDEKDMITVLKKWLEIKGFKVISAFNGTEAITLARKEKPDIMVLDICLPDIDGGEVARELKNYPETENIPIIFLTALLSKDEENKDSHMTGGNIMLAKPYNINEILAVINKQLKMKRSLDNQQAIFIQ